VATTGQLPKAEQAADPLIRRWRELGLDPELLKQIVVTPACGLAAATSAADARTRLKLLRDVAAVLGEAAEA
jgi:hypothetical protein